MHDFKGIRQNTKFFCYKNLTLDLKSLKIFGQKSKKLAVSMLLFLDVCGSPGYTFIWQLSKTLC